MLCYTAIEGIGTMSEETMTATELRAVLGSDEEIGYDVPFAAFTWVQWLDLQARMLACFARYQRAIDKRQPQLALLIVLEMHEITAELHKEACAWIGSVGV